MTIRIDLLGFLPMQDYIMATRSFWLNFPVVLTSGIILHLGAGNQLTHAQDLLSSVSIELIQPSQPRAEVLATLPPSVLLPESASENFQQGLDAYQNQQFSVARERWQDALKAYQALGDLNGEATTLTSLGLVSFQLRQLGQAQDYYTQALTIYQELTDLTNTALLLTSLGLISLELNEYLSAQDYYQQALSIYDDLQELSKKVTTLTSLGIVSSRLEQYYKAQNYYIQALSIYQELDYIPGKETALNNLGLLLFRQGDYLQAQDYYNQALSLYQELGDRSGEATVFNNLGSIQESLGNYAQAQNYFLKGLAIDRELKNWAGEATTLNNLGAIARNLGQYSQAQDYYNQALSLYQELGDRLGEATVFNNLGVVARSLEDYTQAEKYYTQSLSVYQELNNRTAQGILLNNLGSIAEDTQQYHKAQQYYSQALALHRELNNSTSEATTLNNLGAVSHFLNDYDQAQSYYLQSLALSRSLGNRSREETALTNLGFLFEIQGQPELAILFYKQAVNVIEEIRQDLQTLSHNEQQSYTNTIENFYKRLADLLLQQDRILEAQRVLDLLKVEELHAYLGNIRGSDNTQQGIAYQRAENQLLERYNILLQGQELAQLERIPVSDRNQTQRQQILELRKKQADALADFNQFLTTPEVAAWINELRQSTRGQTFDLENYSSNLQRDLQTLQNAVIFYPLVLENRLELILVTPYSPPIRRTVNVTREELNQAIIDFRIELTQTNPIRQRNLEPVQRAAQQLYHWLIEPLESELTQIQAQTIIYAPDGQLRYIPLAGLYDGKFWLVERYRINNITAVSLMNLTQSPTSNLQVLAGAFTEGSHQIQVGERQYHFEGLPFAQREVENLAATVPETQTHLNSAFSLDLIYEMNDYSVVHLATHAQFVDGQPEDSFILFGNGEKQTLRDVEGWNLNNVDLVVLSACYTGVGYHFGGGQEILGLGYQMQRQGAKATIATLWAVHDGGTQALMNAFYAALQGNRGNMTKAEALRQAQIALITGDFSAMEQLSGNRGFEFVSSELRSDIQHNLRHPYYWAPFILIGNGL